MTDAEFDPWTASLEDVANEVYRIRTIGRDPVDLSSPGDRHEYADWLVHVLQARSIVEAANIQSEMAKNLVRAIWVLAVVTAILAIAAVVTVVVALVTSGH